MFHSSTIFRRQERGPAHSVAYMLEMPAGSEGKTVPTGTVVMALLWQYYGLDLLHPEVSRWLEQNAPDVKYAVVERRPAKGDRRDCAEFKVGPDGIIRVYLSLETIDRLRDISSQYLLRQVRNSAEPRKEPRKEQIEPEIIQAIIAQAAASSLSVNDYLTRLLGSALQRNCIPDGPRSGF